MYPEINTLARLLHQKGISTFLVTNAQFPEAIKLVLYIIYSIIIIIILHLPVTSVRRAEGHGTPCIRPELKSFLSFYRWTWMLHEATH